MSFRVVNGSTHTEDGWRCCNRDECDIVRIPELYYTDTAPLRKGAPLTILGAWLLWYDRNVEEIVSPVWGWSIDNDVLGGYGQNNGSNHLSATAVDVNAPKYPWGSRVMPAAKIAKVREGMALFSLTGRWQDSVIYWGADWNRADEMHYQMRFQEGDQRNEQFAQKLRDGYLGIYGPSAPADAAPVLARATGLSESRAREILPAVRDGLAQSEATSASRIAMWLAQVGHESDSFNATEEYEDGDETQDRWRYKGRTWIQLTWRSAYDGFGQWCYDRGLVSDPDVFVNNPRSLADLKWAGLGAAYYWTTTRRETRKYPTLNEASDARDVLVATQIINGGTNGLSDRQQRYNRASAVGDALLQILSPEGDDFLSALTDAEQREVLDLLRQQAKYRRPSKSPLRHLGEGDVNTCAGFAWTADGLTHPQFVLEMAKIGHAESIALIAEVAGADLSEYPDRAADKELALSMLRDLETNHPDILQQYLNGARQ